MSQHLKVFLVDSNETFIDQVEDIFIKKQALGIDVAGRATTKNEFFYNKETLLKVDLFVISSNLPDGTGIELVDYIKSNASIRHKPIIFTVDKQTRNYASVATEKKVDKVYQKPFSFKDFVNTINQLGSNHKNSLLDENQDDDADDNNDFLAQTEETGFVQDDGLDNDNIFQEIDSSNLLNTEEDETKTDNSDSSRDDLKGLYTFVSPSSSGKSSMIINIAYALRTKPENKPSVCIVDLNLLYPDIIYLFDQEELSDPRSDIYDISADLAYMNNELISQALITHGPTDIHILHTPTDLESIHKINMLKSDQIEKILVQLKNMFDVVLVDTGNVATDLTTLVPVQHSDKIFLMMEPHYLDVVGANKIFYIFKKLEGSIQESIISQTQLILNRETKYKRLDDETVEKFLENKRFSIRIPEEEQFISYLNKGKFLVDSESTLSKKIIDFAKIIYPFKITNDKKKSKSDKSIFKKFKK